MKTSWITNIMLGMIILNLLGCVKKEVEPSKKFAEKQWILTCVRQSTIFTKKCEREKIGERIDDEDAFSFLITLALDATLVHLNNKKIKKQCSESKENDYLVECQEFVVSPRTNSSDSSIVLDFPEKDWSVKCRDKTNTNCSSYLILKKNKGQVYSRER